jgi:hypothetical protein
MGGKRTHEKAMSWDATTKPPLDPYRYLALAVIAQAYNDLRGWGRRCGEAWHRDYPAPQHWDALSAIAFLGSADCEGWLDMAELCHDLVQRELAERLATLGIPRDVH